MTQICHANDYYYANATIVTNLQLRDFFAEILNKTFAITMFGSSTFAVFKIGHNTNDGQPTLVVFFIVFSN